LEKLGLIKATYPKNKKYEVIVILEGTPWDTLERFSFLKELLIFQRLNMTKIIYIKGRRSLYLSEKQWLEEKRYGKLSHQHEAAQLIWQKSIAPSLNNHSLEIMTIDPPKGRRANTKDTVKEFFKAYCPHTVLFITNGPYGPFQGEIVKAVVVSEKIKVNHETIQSATRESISTTSILDTIARRIYAMLQHNSAF
jgi:hypothetical protein